MRTAKLLVGLWFLGCLMMWARGGQRFAIWEPLPWVQRSHSLSADYDWLAVAMLCLFAWGYLRLKNRR